MNKPELKHIDLADIIVMPQVRTIFDEDPLKELTESIKEKGVLQPIVINKVKGKYYLVCGERRYRGSKNAKMTTIPAAIHSDLTPDEVLNMQIIENLHRKDVHPMEEAIAFRRMMTENKFDIAEIAKRVTKSTAYVGARMKLGDLIVEYQKAFYANKMTLVTAMKICKLSTPDQRDMYKEEHKDDDKITVNNSDLQKYSHNLVLAPFDTKDAKLNSTAGACTTCPDNTASNTYLFPEEAGKAICMNSRCFRMKCDAAYLTMLAEAVKDPKTILVEEGYRADIVSKEGLDLVKKGEKVYPGNSYNCITLPEPIDESEFDMENYYGSEQDRDKEYAQAQKIFNDEVQEYHKAAASGKYIKAFVISGDNKGHIFYVTLNKDKKSSPSVSRTGKPTAAMVKDKIKSGKVTEADINGEIQRIKDAEKRKQEIDMEKAWPLIHGLLRKNADFITNKKPLSINEKVALILILEDQTGRTHASFQKEIKAAIGYGDGFTHHSAYVDWLKKRSDEKLNEIIANLSRIFFYSNINTYYKINNADLTALDAVISGYDATGRKKILDQVEADRKKRADRIDSVIADLKDKKKNLTPVNAKPAKKVKK